MCLQGSRSRDGPADGRLDGVPTRGGSCRLGPGRREFARYLAANGPLERIPRGRSAAHLVARLDSYSSRRPIGSARRSAVGDPELGTGGFTSIRSIVTWIGARSASWSPDTLGAVVLGGMSSHGRCDGLLGGAASCRRRYCGLMPTPTLCTAGLLGGSRVVAWWLGSRGGMAPAGRTGADAATGRGGCCAPATPSRVGCTGVGVAVGLAGRSSEISLPAFAAPPVGALSSSVGASGPAPLLSAGGVLSRLAGLAAGWERVRSGKGGASDVLAGDSEGAVAELWCAIDRGEDPRSSW